MAFYKTIATALVCLAGMALAASPARGQDEDALQSPRLAKGEDFSVHAVPVMPGYLIVHSVPSTGVMKALLKASPPVGNPNSRAVRVRHCAGVAVDQERMYVLIAERNEKVVTEPGATVIPPQFSLTLHAFALADGKRLMGEGLGMGRVERAPETLGAGLLRLTDSGVETDQGKVEFDGRTVTQVELQGRRFTPPADLFENRRFNY